MSVGMWRANGNSIPCTDLDKKFYAHPQLLKESFGAVLILSLSAPWGWGA